MRKNSTLIELLMGILVVGIVCQLLCLFFFRQYVYNAVGLWTGVAIASGMAVHMQRTIEDGLDMMADSGVKHMQKASASRMLVACALMAVVMYYDWGNPLTLLLGVMALKLAAYMQPFMHRVLGKKSKGG